MNTLAAEISDKPSYDLDGFPVSDGPLFYSLSQSAQDELTAHFLALATAADAPSAQMPELLAA